MSRAKPYFQKVGARLRDTLLFPAMSTPLAQNRCSRRHAQLLKYNPFKIQYVISRDVANLKLGYNRFKKWWQYRAVSTACYEASCICGDARPPARCILRAFWKTCFSAFTVGFWNTLGGGLGMSLGPPNSSIFWGSSVILPDWRFLILKVII